MRIMYIMLNYGLGIGTAITLLALPALTWSDDESALLLRSRQLTADYATQLQTALQSSLADGGPTAAITVCAELAPAVASELARSSGAKVRRTSLRYRNPQNAPDAWEARALVDLEASGSSEMFDPDAPGGPRYLKAIPTGAVCLACHGEKLAPAVQQRLDEAYPHDRATGFVQGDLRGAFSIAWPAHAAAGNAGD